MRLIEELKSRKDDGRVAERLHVLANDLRDATTPHLKRIIAQLPEYDLHDADHSVAVIKNIEELLGEKLSQLSSYELFLLFAAAYIHDIGMALPDPEFRLLELTEGTDTFGGEPAVLAIKNDLKAPWTLVEALRFISSHAIDLYGSFESVKKWPFACSQETSYREDLAQRLVAYQLFRNGYATALRRLQNTKDQEGYRHLSEQIRCEFIRETHHTRAAACARNLAEMFEQRLGGAWGAALAADLGKVSRSHGEHADHVLDLDTGAAYLGVQTANLSFVSVLLRIADVMHYSYERAPQTLFGEKVFRSLTSFTHWAIKNQGVNVCVAPNDAQGLRQIAYRAFCREPEYFYILQSYMDGVDSELALFMRGVREWRRKARSHESTDRYNLDLVDRVSRDGVRADESVFTPKQGLSFTLDQRRVLDLLTGVGLYKDKYACIRELYQNALDACRCMLASKGIHGDQARGEIEFGISDVESVDGKFLYLYCRDNGIGMTQHIVENFLLKVGNSYYVSAQFQRASVTWRSVFTPTSQFGIGILSSFILGSRIEITSTAMPVDNGQGKAIRFSIGGLHEQFYYMQPDLIDVEKIGPHGTLVKVFLKQEEARMISASRPANILLLMHAEGSGGYDITHKEQMTEWKRNLVKHVTDYVAVANDAVGVQVRFDDGTVAQIPDSILPFGLNTPGLTLDDLAAVEKSEVQIGHRLKRTSIRGLAAKINTVSLRVSNEGVEFRGLLNLPNAGFPESETTALDAVPMLCPCHVLIDGIVTKADAPLEKHLLRGLISVGVINFTGSVRPQLSFDRTSITSWPAETESIMRGLLSKVLAQIRESVSDHMTAQGLNDASPETILTWEHILERFWFCTGEIVASLAKEHRAIRLPDLQGLTEHAVTVGEFIGQQTTTLRGMRFSALSAIAKIIVLGKMVKATKVSVAGSVCHIESSSFVPLDDQYFYYRMREAHVIVKADEWSGECADYDVYSPVWPVIPERLFDVYGRGSPDQEPELITERAKRVRHYGNSISALVEQDPVTVHPTMGLYTGDDPSWPQEDVQNWVHRFSKAADKFWLYEINAWQGSGKSKRRYVLTVYIAPRQLSDAEAVSLEHYAVAEPAYVKGVREGWSVLAVGNQQCTIVILPGQNSRRTLVNAIPNQIWSEIREKYDFLDGTSLTEFRPPIQKVEDEGGKAS